MTLRPHWHKLNLPTRPRPNRLWRSMESYRHYRRLQDFGHFRNFRNARPFGDTRFFGDTRYSGYFRRFRGLDVTRELTSLRNAFHSGDVYTSGCSPLCNSLPYQPLIRLDYDLLSGRFSGRATLRATFAIHIRSCLE